MNQYSLRLEETVTVLVGKEEVAFTIHAEMFRKRSAYWKAALSERWRAGKDAIRLQSQDPEEFNLYIRCVYSGIASIKKDEFSGHDVYVHDLTYLYILADSFGDWKVANTCIDQIQQILREKQLSLDPSYVEVCYSNSTKNSPLRRLCVHRSMLDANIIQYFGSVETFPAEFYHDLAVAQTTLLNRCRGYSQQQAGALVKSRLVEYDPSTHHRILGTESSPTSNQSQNQSSSFNEMQILADYRQSNPGAYFL
nr:hypothetical protein CFP56_13242 [Quercus suber]